MVMITTGYGYAHYVLDELCEPESRRHRPERRQNALRVAHKCMGVCLVAARQRTLHHVARTTHCKSDSVHAHKPG